MWCYWLPHYTQRHTSMSTATGIQCFGWTFPPIWGRTKIMSPPFFPNMGIFELVFECTNLLSKQCHLHQYSNKYKSELRTTQYLWFCFKWKFYVFLFGWTSGICIKLLSKLFPHQMLHQQLMLVMARANDLSYVVPMMTEGGWLHDYNCVQLYRFYWWVDNPCLPLEVQ